MRAAGAGREAEFAAVRAGPDPPVAPGGGLPEGGAVPRRDGQEQPARGGGCRPRWVPPAAARGGAAGDPRPGSARNRAVTRRRRIALGAAAVALVAAVGACAWAATSGDDAGASPQDTGTSAPSTA